MEALSHLRIVEIGSAAAASNCDILIDGRDVDVAALGESLRIVLDPTMKDR